MDNVSLHNEDCFITMERMNENNEKVDIILTSPPYNTSRPCKTAHAFEIYNNRYDMHLDNMTDEQYEQWTLKLFESFDKILAKNGVILYNLSYGAENPNCMWQAIAALVKDSNFMIADTIIWKKNSALPHPACRNKLTRITEFVFVICRKKEYKTFTTDTKVVKVSPKGQNYYEVVYNFIEAPNNDGACKLNKATYSSELCMKLLDIYAPNGSLVYDPFMGTGTTAVACLKSDKNLRCIGSELSSAQVEYSKKRILENHSIL